MRTPSDLEQACGGLNMEQIGMICDYVSEKSFQGEVPEAGVILQNLLELDTNSGISHENVEAQIELSLRELAKAN